MALYEVILSPGKVLIFHTETDKVIANCFHEGLILYKDPSGKDGPPTYDPCSKRNGISSVSSETVGKKIFHSRTGHGGALKLVASPYEEEDSLKIHQDIRVFSAFLREGSRMVHGLKNGRNAWLHIVQGRIASDGFRLQGGDGAGFSGEKAVSFTALEPSQILLFEVA
jgi:redox-sensitive bicupin YhaK (pirin superfamily)